MQVSVCLNYKMIGKRQLYYILKRATHALKYTMYTIAQNTSLILNFIIFLLKNDPYMHVQIVEDYIDAYYCYINCNNKNILDKRTFQPECLLHLE